MTAIPKYLIIGPDESKEARMESYRKWAGDNKFPDPEVLTVAEFSARGMVFNPYEMSASKDIALELELNRPQLKVKITNPYVGHYIEPERKVKRGPKFTPPKKKRKKR